MWFRILAAFLIKSDDSLSICHLILIWDFYVIFVFNCGNLCRILQSFLLRSLTYRASLVAKSCRLSLAILICLLLSIIAILFRFRLLFKAVNEACDGRLRSFSRRYIWHHWRLEIATYVIKSAQFGLLGMCSGQACLVKWVLGERSSTLIRQAWSHACKVCVIARQLATKDIGRSRRQII